jgi:hypothetical protein
MLLASDRSKTEMNADFTSRNGRVNSCCGGDRADAKEAFRSSLELHRANRAHTLEMVREFSQYQMDFEPAAGKWSVGEVLDHLILGQRLNLSYIAEVIGMKKAGQRPVLRLSVEDVDVSIGFIPKSILPVLEVPLTVFNLFLPDAARDFLTSHRLIPAQNPELTAPRRSRPADDLRNDLMVSLRETEELLESDADLDFSGMLIQHPLLGNKNVPGLLRFLALHEQRHQAQIESIVANPGFPGST